MSNTHLTVDVVANQPPRPTHTVSLQETFSLETVKDVEIEAFQKPGPLTPQINNNYIFPKSETVEFLRALEGNETTYFVGHSGTGKTELVNQVAARLNYNVLTINFDGSLTRPDLIGEIALDSGSTKFRYGLIPTAFSTPGTIVLLDEIDACPPETAFVLQRAVSDDRKILLHETNQLLSLHPQNRIVGTANTNGLQDDTFLYSSGTHTQNFSFLNRWNTCIKLEYLSQPEEHKMLTRMFEGKVSASYVMAVSRVLEATRTAFKNGQGLVPLTTRDGINWLNKLASVPLPLRAARYSFLDKLPQIEAMALAQLIQRYFDVPDRDDKTYLGA